MRSDGAIRWSKMVGRVIMQFKGLLKLPPVIHSRAANKVNPFGDLKEKSHIYFTTKINHRGLKWMVSILFLMKSTVCLYHWYRNA